MGVSQKCVVAAALALGAGCVHIHTDPDGKLKSVDFKGTPGKTDVAPKVDPAVKPASATVPATASLSKLTGSGVPAKGAAAEMAVTWQPRLATLPDPTKNGAPVTGIVGQMFLFDANLKFVQPTGKLVLEMFDDSPLPGGVASDSRRLGGWTFQKDALRRMVIFDERLGKCYALFLPWPDYSPSVTRVKLTTRFDPDNGYPLYAESTTLTFDTTIPGATVGAPPTKTGGSLPRAGFLGLPPVSAPPTTAVAAPALNPVPVGGASATPLPPGLTPIVITAPGR